MANMYNSYGWQNYAPYQQQYQQQPQIQNGGLVPVTSEQEARDYLVANGTSVAFINSNEKKLYIKTKGFSAMDAPTFAKYSLVEDTGEVKAEPTPVVQYAEKSEIDALRNELDNLNQRFNKFTKRGKTNEQ